MKADWSVRDLYYVRSSTCPAVGRCYATYRDAYNAAMPIGGVIYYNGKKVARFPPGNPSMTNDHPAKNEDVEVEQNKSAPKGGFEFL